MGPRPADLAGLYAPTFIVVGPKGSQAFTNDSCFLGWLRQIAEVNRRHGLFGESKTARFPISPERTGVMTVIRASLLCTSLRTPTEIDTFERGFPR